MLLPGLDGTGTLFDDLVRLAPPELDLQVVSLPIEPLGYAALAERLASALRLDAQTVLVAESFSGPLAILLAERERVGAVVLCNSFVMAPRSPLVGVVALPLSLGVRPPGALVRRYLVGAGAPDALVERVRQVVDSVPPSVLASRLRSVLRVDVSAALARGVSPVLCLRGTDDRLVREASVRAIVAAGGERVSVARIAGPHLLLQAEPAAAWEAMRSLFRRGPVTVA